MRTKKILEEIGLSSNEIKVYFSLLELGESSATPILRKSKVPHSKIYPILDKLIEKGLVAFIIHNNVKYFCATDPDNLLKFIEKKEESLALKKLELKKNLSSLPTTKKKILPQARSYRGLKGIKVALFSMINKLEAGDTYYVFTLGEELGTDILRKFFGSIHRERIKRGVKVRLLSNKSIKKIISKYPKYKNMEIRYTNQSLPVGLFISETEVISFIWDEEPYAFLIESEKNAKYYRSFFEELWKQATK